MFTKITMSQAPKRSRKSESRFERTPDWKDMKSSIDRGLKPQEGVQVILTDEEKAKYGISNRRTIARFVKKYLASKSLKYTLKSFHREGVGDFIIVGNDIPVTKIKRRSGTASKVT